MRRHGFAVLAAIPVLVLGLTACGSDDGGKKGASGTKAQTVSDQEKARKFAQCMRTNGVDMPDPETNDGGGIAIRAGKVKGKSTKADESKFKAAMNKCRSLMPNGGKPPKLTPEDSAKMREFAKCMRQHGVDMPDPSDDGAITIKRKAGAGGAPAKGLGDDKKLEDAQKACQRYMPKLKTSGGGKG